MAEWEAAAGGRGGAGGAGRGRRRSWGGGGPGAERGPRRADGLPRAASARMVVSPTRMESPTLERPGLVARGRRSRTSRSPSRGPRCVSRPPASRTTRAWRRESSGSSASRPSPLTARPITSSSPSVSRRPLAGPRGHQQLLRAASASASLPAGGTPRPAASAPGTPTRGVGHLQDRLAHPHDVAQVQRSRGVDALAVHERPVRRPEILDRELSARAAREPRVAARDLGVVAEPSLLLRSRTADEQVGLHRPGCPPRALPSVTRSCSPAISRKPYASAAAPVR